MKSYKEMSDAELGSAYTLAMAEPQSDEQLLSEAVDEITQDLLDQEIARDRKKIAQIRAEMRRRNW